LQIITNYLKVFTDERMYLISETLIHIATRLSEHFQRTHKSYIANLERVSKATRTHLLIENNKIPISAMYKVAVSEKIAALAKS
ncbi:MAG: LytTR family DNA-binding domain-containing protein, partial [Bacteroidota bacterium]